MLRTPRARLSAIKYMDKRIPATLKAVRDHRDRNLIYISDFETYQLIVLDLDFKT